MRPPPLQGLRVLDFGQMIAVPYVTQVLGWLGAEIILVENPHLQSVRILPPYAEGVRGINRSGGFNMMSTNKRSLVLDIGVPEGLALAKRLAAISDVVVENFTTGVADKLGLAYEDIRAVRPDVVYLSVAAFGRSGPLKNFAGFHSVVNLFTGVAATTGYPGGHPSHPRRLSPRLHRRLRLPARRPPSRPPPGQDGGGPVRRDLDDRGLHHLHSPGGGRVQPPRRRAEGRGQPAPHAGAARHLRLPGRPAVDRHFRPR